jgi:hypothetical protein
MNASAHGRVPRSRRLDGHRFEAGRGRLAHLFKAYLDEMSKAVIGLVGHVLKRLGAGLMALFRYDAARENDTERIARHFDERGEDRAQKEFEARLSVWTTSAPVADFFPAAGTVEAALGLPRRGTEAEGNSTLNRSTPRCPPWPSRPQAQRRSPWQAPPRRQSSPTTASLTAYDFRRRHARRSRWPCT